MRRVAAFLALEFERVRYLRDPFHRSPPAALLSCAAVGARLTAGCKAKPATLVRSARRGVGLLFLLRTVRAVHPGKSAGARSPLYEVVDGE